MNVFFLLALNYLNNCIWIEAIHQMLIAKHIAHLIAYFFETSFGDLTPPGILITKSMTAQDVEKMRENRRRAIQLRRTTSNYDLRNGGRRYKPSNRRPKK